MRAWILLAWLLGLGGGPGGPRPEEARPWLGVTLAERGGEVAIDNVFTGSPAEAAGIRAGDLVRRINGEKPHTAKEVVHEVGRTGVGGTLKLRLASGAGAGEHEIAIKLGIRPDIREMQRTQLVGRAAPDFDIKKAQGVYAARLAALKGQVVLLDFWATWCGPCLAALPHVQELHERFAKRGLRVLGVTSDDWEQVSEFVRRRGLTYAQVSDEDNQIGMRYFVTAIPTLIVIGRDGKVIDVSIGDLGTVDKTLSDLLK